MNLLDISVIVGIIAIYIFIFILSYNFYIATDINRFSYRYIIVISALTVFHLMLAIFQELTGTYMFQEARWLAFDIINVYYLEIFIRDIPNLRAGKIFIPSRISEIAVRLIFILGILGNWILDFYWFDVINGLILIGLASQFRYLKVRKAFMITFFFYIIAMNINQIIFPIVPDSWNGLTNFISLMAGAVFSASFAASVFIMYRNEKIEVRILERIREVKRNEKTSFFR